MTPTTMFGRSAFLAAALALFLAAATEATAACDDPAGEGVDWSGCDKSGADLTGAYLGYANLTNAVLTKAILEDVSLWGADLSGANLNGAVLNEACLSETVRRHINWNNLRPDLKEDLAHLVQDIRRRVCGIAIAVSPSF